MTLHRLRSLLFALICALPLTPALADDSSGNPPMPQVVRGSSGNQKPAAPQATGQQPNGQKQQNTANKPCVPTPEAQAAGTAAAGINGTFAGSRWTTAPMSTEGAAVMLGAQQAYGCR